MADPPPDPGSDLNSGDDAMVGPSGYTGTPGWVKVFAVVAIVVVLLLVIVLLLGGGPGGHGPTRHTPP